MTTLSLQYINSFVCRLTCAGYVWRVLHHFNGTQRFYAESSDAHCTSDKWYSSGGLNVKVSAFLMTGWRKAPLISEMPPARVIPPELGVCVSETQRGSMHMIVWISVKSRVCVGVWMNVWDYVCWQMGVNGHPTICTHPTHKYTHTTTRKTWTAEAKPDLLKDWSLSMF